MSVASHASDYADRINQKFERELGDLVVSSLEDPDVIEIMLNPDGGLWVERFGRPMARLGEMPPHQAEAAMATLAAINRTTITRISPILECNLPDGSRFEGMIPPVVEGPSFCIRKRASRIFTLEDYVQAKAMTPRQRDLIRQAALNHRNILVVGGTGSGKTTLVNAVIQLIGEELPDERLLILEDTAEIQCDAPNHVFKRTTDLIDLNRLLRSTMRYRPDRIIVGEVRGGECLELLKAWNTGHPGGVATVHANDAKSGLIRLENLVAEVTEAPMHKTIAAAIDLIVVIAKVKACKAGRQVQELLHVHDHDGRNYIVEVEE